MKLNTENSMKGNPGLARAEGIIRDDARRWFGGFIHNIDMTISVGAECWMVKLGLN